MTVNEAPTLLESGSSRRSAAPVGRKNLVLLDVGLARPDWDDECDPLALLVETSVTRSRGAGSCGGNLPRRRRDDDHEHPQTNTTSRSFYLTPLQHRVRSVITRPSYNHNAAAAPSRWSPTSGGDVDSTQMVTT